MGKSLSLKSLQSYAELGSKSIDKPGGADILPGNIPKSSSMSGNSESWKLNVSQYLTHYGHEIVNEKPHGDATLYCLDKCIFNSDHGSNEAAVVQQQNGKLSYQCFHDSCHDKKWKDAKKIISGNDELTSFFERKPCTTGKTCKKTISAQILDIVKSQVSLFHSPDGTGFVVLTKEGCQQTWPLNSKEFKNWLSYQYYLVYQKPPADRSLKEALVTLEGKARFEGEEHEVFLRVAPYGDGYVIDLCNDSWEVIVLDKNGWTLVSDSPVYFRRTQTSLALPTPLTDERYERCELLQSISNHINIPEDELLLYLALLLDYFRPDTASPVTVFIGEQGTAKSTTAKRTRELVDPNKVLLLTEPLNRDDLLVGASGNWIVNYNNLTRLKEPMQDALCSMCTGGGFLKRQLYSDLDIVSCDIQRPVILNGIGGDIISTSDLYDRAVIFQLQRIKSKTRKTDTDLDQAFEKDREKLFASLLDLFVLTLQELPNVSLQALPRMADFALFGVAVQRALGTDQSFIDIYDSNRGGTATKALEASPAALALLDFAELNDEGFWTGTVKELFDQLSDLKNNETAWPRSPRGLAEILKRYAPTLEITGVNITFDQQRRSDGYHLTITKME